MYALSYFLKQCAAVMTHLLDIIAHPQTCSSSACIEHLYGAAPSGAVFPPKIRLDAHTGMPSNSFEVISITTDFYVQFSYE